MSGAKPSIREMLVANSGICFRNNPSFSRESIITANMKKETVGTLLPPVVIFIELFLYMSTMNIKYPIA